MNKLFRVPKDATNAAFDVLAEAIKRADEGDWLEPSSSEVDSMREFARSIGRDPARVTPQEDRPRYCPGHSWVSFWRYPYAEGSAAGESRRCALCALVEVVS